MATLLTISEVDRLHFTDMEPKTLRTTQLTTDESKPET